MKPIRITTITAVLIFGGYTFAADPVPKADQLSKQLAGEGAPAAKTPIEFELAYAQVLPSLLTKPDTDDVALQKIVFYASRPDAEVERAALCKVMAAHVLNESSVTARVVLLRHLQRIGARRGRPHDRPRVSTAPTHSYANVPAGRWPTSRPRPQPTCSAPRSPRPTTPSGRAR